MPEPFSHFLEASFSALRRDVPEVWARFCRHFAGRAIALTVDGEPLAIRFAEGTAYVDGDCAPAAIAVAVDRATILDLVDGRATLVDVVLGDRLRIRCTPDELLLFHDGLLLYLHGAVRAPSLPALLAIYRAAGMPSRAVASAAGS